jgi:hypothetical protein
MCRARGRLTKTSQIRFERRVECWLAFFGGHKVRKSCPKKGEILAVSAEALHAARTEATKQALHEDVRRRSLSRRRLKGSGLMTNTSRVSWRLAGPAHPVPLLRCFSAIRISRGNRRILICRTPNICKGRRAVLVGYGQHAMERGTPWAAGLGARRG